LTSLERIARKINKEHRMANKHLLFRAEAREKVLRGATALADGIRVTLGPRSKCVLIEKKWGRPLVCKDGVTIAKEINLKDPEENLGAHMIREAAERTGDAVGDGTSTATILAHAIYAEGLRNVTAGASAVDLKRGLDRGLRAAVATIRKLSRPVESRREKAQIAAISAHNDQAPGDLVADAMEKVGHEGVVSVEEAKGTETSLEVVEGMQFDRGYLSPFFITDSEKMQAILVEPLILLYEKKISTLTRNTASVTSTGPLPSHRKSTPTRSRAECREGVLTLHLPKQERAKPKRIAVKAG
jgi:chaperonin GroEL